MFDFSIVTKSNQLKMQQRIEKHQPEMANQTIKLIRQLPDTWRMVAKHHPEISRLVNVMINDKLLLQSVFDDQRLKKENVDGVVYQPYVNYVVHAMICLVIAVGERNAMRFFELSPAIVLIALKDVINYTSKPTADNIYHTKFQEMIISELVVGLAHELYPSRFYHGALTILSDFNISEELLGFILDRVTLSGKNIKMVLN